MLYGLILIIPPPRKQTLPAKSITSSQPHLPAIQLKSYNSIFSYGGEDSSKVAIYYCLDFRGQESPYVIVTDIQGNNSAFRANYLSGSRAKFRLVLIHVKDKIVLDAEKTKIPKKFTI